MRATNSCLYTSVTLRMKTFLGESSWYHQSEIPSNSQVTHTENPVFESYRQEDQESGHSG